MSRLEELIQELCPDGVEYRKLEDCCTVLDKKRKPVAKAARVAGEYPYYGANGIQDYVSDYIFDGIFVLVGEDGSVITKAGTPVVTWAEGKIWVNNHAHIIEENDDVLLRYLFHYIQTIDVTNLIHGNIPKLTGRDFRALQIPVPPLEVQREIVRILDSFTLLTAELTEKLTAELTARKKQYEYYRDELLKHKADIPMVKLEDICLKVSSVNWKKEISTKSYIDLTSVSIDKHCIIDDNVTTVSSDNAPSRAKQLIKKNDILFGGTRPMLKRFCIVEDKYDNQVCSTGYCVLRIDNQYALTNYIYHIIGTTSFYSYVEANQQGASYPAISDKTLKQYKFVLPAIEEQQRIVDVLDSFDSLCNDISIGLPAEIEARQKQYEFYRDKLLSFKPL